MFTPRATAARFFLSLAEKFSIAASATSKKQKTRAPLITTPTKLSLERIAEAHGKNQSIVAHMSLQGLDTLPDT